jgi:hypothetical protein
MCSPMAFACLGGLGAITSVGIFIEEVKQVLSLMIISRKVCTDDTLEKACLIRGCRLFAVLPESSLDGSMRHGKRTEDDLDILRTA